MADSGIGKKRKRYYTEGKVISVEETCHHEFKAHSNICEEEIPEHAVLDGDRRSRAPVSRAINAFLNSGTGGTVYMGVLDSGEVKGFHMTQYTKDHIQINVNDLLSNRYNPPVDPHRYKVKFIPVVEENYSNEQLETVLNFNSKTTVDAESRRRNHSLRRNTLCWCHVDCKAQLQHGKLPPCYVIEMTIFPWNPSDPRNAQSGVGQLNTYPIHQDEMGECWFRRQASLIKYDCDEISRLAKETVAACYGPQIDSLQAEIKTLQKELLQK